MKYINFNYIGPTNKVSFEMCLFSRVKSIPTRRNEEMNLSKELRRLLNPDQYRVRDTNRKELEEGSITFFSHV